MVSALTQKRPLALEHFPCVNQDLPPFSSQASENNNVLHFTAPCVPTTLRSTLVTFVSSLWPPLSLLCLQAQGSSLGQLSASLLLGPRAPSCEQKAKSPDQQNLFIRSLGHLIQGTLLENMLVAHQLSTYCI